MTIVFNSWKLDTCTCRLHYSFDNAVPQDQIQVTFFAVEDVCSDHEGLIGLDKGEPDWIQSDHTVEAENAARIAYIDAALDDNETKNLAAAKNQDDINKIQTALNAHRQEVMNRYSNMFAITNTKAISKGIWNTAKEENDRKNNGIKEILAVGPSSLYDLVDGTSRTPKESAKIQFSWSGIAPNRVLTISTIISLTTQQRTTIQNRLNTIFGVGKVVLE